MTSLERSRANKAERRMLATVLVCLVYMAACTMWAARRVREVTAECKAHAEYVIELEETNARLKKIVQNQASRLLVWARATKPELWNCSRDSPELWDCVLGRVKEVCK